ncbi:MAG TPA: branched-chain amino acid ABC transporter substrate-binding protein, partial [Rhizobium sp.]|nr:branched-chain amino acid ABC transporter substrate-binding protein [Rhizobium sp.]
KTPDGQGLADETKKAMNAAGVTEVMYEGITPGDKDYSALIAKMKEAGVTVVYFGGLHTEFGLIERQAADQGLKAAFMSGDGIVSNELASIAGDAVNGTLMTFAPDPRKNPAAKDLVEKFRAGGFEPEAYTLYSYAALQVIAEAAKKVGSNDPEAIATAMKEQGPYATVIGELGFDAKGDITRPDYVMYTWKKGEDGKYSYFQD